VRNAVDTTAPRAGAGSAPSGEGCLIAIASFGVIVGWGRDATARPPWPGSGLPFAGEIAADQTWYAWRVSGANHRELGRSTMVHPDIASVLSAIKEFRVNIDKAVLSFTITPAGGHWTWRMVIDGEPAATSSRSYFRQRECAYAATAFTAAIEVATIPTVPGRQQRALQMNGRRTPHGEVAYGLPAPAESLNPHLASIPNGRRHDTWRGCDDAEFTDHS
jgi:hypothetical protein